MVEYSDSIKIEKKGGGLKSIGGGGGAGSLFQKINANPGNSNPMSQITACMETGNTDVLNTYYAMPSFNEAEKLV